MPGRLMAQVSSCSCYLRSEGIMAGSLPRSTRPASAFLFLIAIAMLLGAAREVAAQNVGTVAGAIKDAQGLAVPGTTVTLVNRVSQTSQETVSDEQGKYTLANVPFGIYVLSANLSGFSPA